MTPSSSRQKTREIGYRGGRHSLPGDACFSFFLAGLVALLGTGACNSNGLGEQERKEIVALERTLVTLTTTVPEDLLIRLEEVGDIEVKTPRVREVQRLCISSYRAFGKAHRLLAEARFKTTKAENAMKAARARKEAGEELTEEKRAALVEMSRNAGASLTAVNGALDEAEKLVDQCDLERSALRALLEQT